MEAEELATVATGTAATTLRVPFSPGCQVEPLPVFYELDGVTRLGHEGFWCTNEDHLIHAMCPGWDARIVHKGNTTLPCLHVWVRRGTRTGENASAVACGATSCVRCGAAPSDGEGNDGNGGTRKEEGDHG